MIDLKASYPPVEMDADVRLEAVREALAELILVPYKQSPNLQIRTQSKYL